MSSFSSALLRWFSDYVSLQPDLSRAVRATLAFMVPLLLALHGSLSVEVSFAAIAAQNIAMVDIRGDYRLRFALVLGMAAVLVGSAALGSVASGSLVAAMLAAGAMALAGGLWRHLSSEYGPALAISSTFVFLFALGSSGSGATVRSHVLAALTGAAWGLVLQVGHWPFRPQHALRRTIADSWVAIADLFAALTPEAAAGVSRPGDRVRECEVGLRSALDTAYRTLETARPGGLRNRLTTLNTAAARLATTVAALDTALESAAAQPRFAALAPALDPALTSLANLSRSAAIAVVSRQSSHLATFEVRLRRVGSLLRTLGARVKAQSDGNPTDAQLAEIIRQIDAQLSIVHDAVRATVDPVQAPAASSFELLDLRVLALRPLASALNLNLHFDPALVRYTLRLAVLLVAGVAIFKLWGLPHGYWLPFTTVVVLQPDYGSTRQRAAQRMLGTLAGSVAASALLWLYLPHPALLAAAAGTMFAFGYWVKRNYALAIFFITLFIVILTGATEPVTLGFALERLGTTAAGGILALLAAQLFWPAWERDRLPAILAQAFRLNRDYLHLLLARLRTGGSFDAAAVLAKRQAESANSAVFSSLQRMSGDPESRRDGLDLAAMLANGNQRLTRCFNVLALHLAPDAVSDTSALDRFAPLGHDAFELLIESVERGLPPPGRIGPLVRALESELPPAGADGGRGQWIVSQLTRAATELSALLLAAEESAPARTDALPPGGA